MDNKDKSSDFTLGVVGNLVASLLLLLTNILAVRFLPAASRELLDILSIVIPLILLLLFLLRGQLGTIRQVNPSVLLVLTVTVFVIVGFGLLFRWISEGRVQNVDSTAPIIYDAYRQIYNVIKR